MPRDLLEPILDGGVTNPHYFEGRLLTAAALREDQDAQRAHHRRLGRPLGPGIVEGLWVTVEFAGSTTLPPRVAVTAGLAINGEGDTLELPAREVVALARAASPPDQGTGLFRTCEPPAAQVEGPGAGFYLLVLSPASGFRGRAPVSGLSDPRAGSGCGSRWAVEGIRFRLLPLDPLAVTGTSAGIRELLENELLTASTEAGRSKLRNVVAHLCLGTEPLATFAADPFARETLPGGGTEAALTNYGALDDLRAAGTLKDCDVPLALLHWPLAGLDFADNWAVRRRPSPPKTTPSWPTLSGGRRRNEAEAVLFQFQEQLRLLVERSTTPTNIRARDYFRWLPPTALVPRPGGGRRGVSDLIFLDGLTTRQPHIFIDGARLVELVSMSLAHPPVDTESGEFLWTYRARQNDLLPTESGSEFPYLVLASGHLPFVGTARFDLARWDRSNFGLL
jgi:hypothetical protein